MDPLNTPIPDGLRYERFRSRMSRSALMEGHTEPACSAELGRWCLSNRSGVNELLGSVARSGHWVLE